MYKVNGKLIETTEELLILASLWAGTPVTELSAAIVFIMAQGCCVEEVDHNDICLRQLR